MLFSATLSDALDFVFPALVSFQHGLIIGQYLLRSNLYRKRSYSILVGASLPNGFLPSLRGMALLASATIVLSLAIAHLLVGSAPVYNSADPGSTLFFVFFLLAPFFFAWLAPSPPVTVFVGLASGGAMANAIDRKLFGPVADYIAVPWSPGMYCNAADVAIFISLLVAAFYAITHLLPVFISREPIVSRDRKGKA